MKKEVTPAMIAAAVIVAVLFLVVLGWKFLGPKGASLSESTVKSHIANNRAQGGQGLAPGLGK